MSVDIGTNAGVGTRICMDVGIDTGIDVDIDWHIIARAQCAWVSVAESVFAIIGQVSRQMDVFGC